MAITEASSSSTSSRVSWELFLISFLILFLELSCIRFLASTVVFLTFFTNIVLMACILGMSLGCLAASRKTNFIQYVIPLLMVTLLLAWGMLTAYNHWGRLTIDVGAQESPQLIFFGTEYRPKDPSHFVVPIEVVAGLFYALLALTFVGLGQGMGRAFNAMPQRVKAYSINILGSLAGIAAFALASYFQTTPVLWFSLCLLLCLYFVTGRRLAQVICALFALAVVCVSAYGIGEKEAVFWSPYYKIRYTAETGLIDTNNISHQKMVKIREEGPAYVLAHLLNRDAGNPPFRDVLIIGAGSGNDVEAALTHGAQHIDAVEIDPVLNRIGREHHPDRPYDNPRVEIHLDDGRSFVQKTNKKFDLAIYALVDSLVLHSSYSSLRLESFLFTEQAFAAIRARLKPGGIFAMYNYYRQGWVVARLKKMAQQEFGAEPLVFSFPYQEKIDAQGSGSFTMILVSNGASPTLENIRRSFAAGQFFWLNKVPQENEATHAFAPAPPVTDGSDVMHGLLHWSKIAPAVVDTAGVNFLPSDRWPFLYLRNRGIPNLNLRGMAVMAGISLVLLFLLAPVRTLKPNGQMFFLGAGFMLLETKGVVHMALLFGSTWVVNSVVFFAILVMTLLGNLYVLALKPKSVWPYYVLLLGALVANAFIPMNRFLSFPGAMKMIASCSVVFVPIFFAGVVFAVCFRDSSQPDRDFGSNIAGIVLGGLSEYFSLILGFENLLWIAVGFYLLSAMLGPRRKVVTV